jgi:hypothetical protein
MQVKFDKAGSNKGSSAAFCNYLEKENKKEESLEEWQGHTKDDLTKYDVQHSIDRDHQGIGSKEGKFTTGSINITEEEFKALGKTDQEREKNFKQFAKEEFTKELADNFNKKNAKGEEIKVEADNVNIYYKMERNRQYKGTDDEVKKGIVKSGENKQGFNHHIHFIVARKTLDKKNRISPTTKNSKEFNQKKFFDRVEKSFDKKSGYNRSLEDTFKYKNTMKNGTFKEKKEFINQHAVNEVKELKHSKTQEKELTQKVDKQQNLQQELSLKRTPHVRGY